MRKFTITHQSVVAVITEMRLVYTFEQYYTRKLVESASLECKKL